MLFTHKTARISQCGTYRYELRRVWDEDRDMCGFIMLNPSTADAEFDDPTIRRCIRFADSWEYGGLLVLNLFALRATDPDELKKHSDPIGPENHRLGEAVKDLPMVIAAWGTHGSLMQRGSKVAREVVTQRSDGLLHCIAKTMKGHPRHPLYLGKHLKPIVYRTANHD